VDEQTFLRALIAGEVRQGALDSTILDALALAGGVSLEGVRRAVMLAGETGAVARSVLTDGEAGLQRFALKVGRPVRPMLAASAPDVRTALERLGTERAVCLDTKLDGIRIQAHLDDGEVRLYTRSLDDITRRLPEVAALVRELPARRVLLDGEVLALDSQGRPRPFQETASRTASAPGAVSLSAFFFDCLLIDGREVMDEPLTARLDALNSVVPERHRIERLITSDLEAAEAFFSAAVGAGQEGVVVKDLAAPYEAGRRGSGWIKVKPRHTLDLVVLAIEWGSGRRSGLLSNIHLGARDPDRPGHFVMLGKTFKGMTDEMLAWQTERFQALAVDPQFRESGGYVVPVYPEQVVEIAFDGVQRSSRYPGGVALRFARVLRYRSDKSAQEADTISAVRSLATWYAKNDD
jgi:DNA ligase-1